MANPSIVRSHANPAFDAAMRRMSERASDFARMVTEGQRGSPAFAAAMRQRNQRLSDFAKMVGDRQRGAFARRST